MEICEQRVPSYTEPPTEKYPLSDFSVLAQRSQSLSWSQLACRRFEVLSSNSSRPVQN